MKCDANFRLELPQPMLGEQYRKDLRHTAGGGSFDAANPSAAFEALILDSDSSDAEQSHEKHAKANDLNEEVDAAPNVRDAPNLTPQTNYIFGGYFRVERPETRADMSVRHDAGVAATNANVQHFEPLVHNLDRDTKSFDIQNSPDVIDEKRICPAKSEIVDLAGEQPRSSPPSEGSEWVQISTPIHIQKIESFIPIISQNLRPETSPALSQPEESPISSSSRVDPKDIHKTQKIITFRLEPAHLGHLNIRMRIAAASVEIEISSGESSVINALQGVREKLDEALTAKGYRLDTLNLQTFPVQTVSQGNSSPIDSSPANVPRNSSNEQSGFANDGQRQQQKHEQTSFFESAALEGDGPVDPSFGVVL